MRITYLVRNANYGKFPVGDIPGGKASLVDVMQKAFGTRGLEVIDDYFIEDSQSYPKNQSFCIFALEENSRLIGGLIATTEKIKTEYGEFKFTYYDKAFIIPEHQDNGLGGRVIDTARIVGSGKEGVLPSILRTSDPKNHKYYLKRKDIITDLEENGIKYLIYGFGFRNKETEEPLFENAEELFRVTAQYVAKKPATVAKKQT